jgi:hypothetical protein
MGHPIIRSSAAESDPESSEVSASILISVSPAQQFLPNAGSFTEAALIRRAAHEGHVMKKLFVLATILLPFALAGCSHPQPASYYPPPPPPAYSQVAEQGHHDGIEAARRDISNGAPPDPARHPRFRNPPVPPPLMEDYRHAFRNGYEEVYRHGPPPGY